MNEIKLLEALDDAMKDIEQMFDGLFKKEHADNDDRYQQDTCKEQNP